MNLLQKFKGTYSDILLFLVLLIYSFKSSFFNQIATFGYIIVLIGVTLWIVSRYQLGDAFSTLPEAKKIIKNGIYKKIRHPIYISGVITFLGLTLVYQKQLFYIVLLLLIILQIIRAIIEEHILVKNFGKEYVEYKKSTWF